MKDGSYHEINLKECHAWTREGCKSCPDFAAEHSDVATGGIGEDNDWTLTIVRTELGEEVIERMIADGSLIARPAQTDETAMRLLRLLSIVSRRRWPKDADAAPAIGVPPPKKKKAAAVKTDAVKTDEVKTDDVTPKNDAVKNDGVTADEVKPKE
jgi:coenzyme F420 hydrogenase subunit beta